MNQFICRKCKAIYPLDVPRWKCDCGSILDIEFEPVFDLEEIERRKPTMWRYREAIPIKNDENIVSFDEGFTPIIEVIFHGRPVLIKQDQLFPTGSYKDRGASVLVSKIKELEIKQVVEDSSGNAGCAISAYCAKADIDCNIFVPEDTAPGKLSQIQFYGAKLNKVPGTREDASNAVLKAAQKIYYASHSWNPFFLHGTKTFAFEICEQLGWKSPDTIILPVGNGTLLLGAYIGFNELFNSKIINKIPKIVAVQAINCAPLHTAFKENLKKVPKINKKDTIAEGIAIADPIRGKQIVEAVEKSNGDFIVVDDSEIKESLKEICKKGFYIEPTSAAATAGVSKYLRKSKYHEIIVSVFTGHGLKTTEKMLKL
ncbi:MAG: threonine synthase [Deltaproteobacteria bacterium]|jgi:threonine synthase|nr:threonine synthase [Deltaproteobacteria bacterium]MBW2237888.1 threonine synthase [Deltaproteobacteria bacterium]MBW2571248.1 threonine synthase [Deltaproteobacteria bacterium]MBW2668877.1 threonine synthase [Deltaproteobacteria bacterium]